MVSGSPGQEMTHQMPDTPKGPDPHALVIARAVQEPVRPDLDFLVVADRVNSSYCSSTGMRVSNLRRICSSSAEAPPAWS